MGLSKWPDHLNDDINNDYVKVSVECEVQVITNKAIGFNDGDDDDLWWIPKSQLEDPDQYEVGDSFSSISITKWFADKEDLEYD